MVCGKKAGWENLACKWKCEKITAVDLSCVPPLSTLLNAVVVVWLLQYRLENTAGGSAVKALAFPLTWICCQDFVF